MDRTADMIQLGNEEWDLKLNKGHQKVGEGSTNSAGREEADLLQLLPPFSPTPFGPVSLGRKTFF